MEGSGPGAGRRRLQRVLVLVRPLLLVQGMVRSNAQSFEGAKVLSPAGAIVSIVALVVLRNLARGGVGDEDVYAPLSQSHEASKSRVQQPRETREMHGSTHLNGSGSDSNSACEHGGRPFALFFMVPAWLAMRPLRVGGVTSRGWW